MEDIDESQVPDTQDSYVGEVHYDAPLHEAGVIRSVELINFMCHSYATRFFSVPATLNLIRIGGLTR